MLSHEQLLKRIGIMLAVAQAATALLFSILAGQGLRNGERWFGCVCGAAWCWCIVRLYQTLKSLR